LIVRTCGALAVVLTVLLSGASAEICAPEQPGVSIYYVNGILSDLSETLDSAVALSRRTYEFLLGKSQNNSRQRQKNSAGVW